MTLRSANYDPANMTRISARLDSDLYNRVQVAAAVHGMTVNAAVSDACELWLSHAAPVAVAALTDEQESLNETIRILSGKDTE